MKNSELARVAHEANRILCEALGDLSQDSWEDAPGWQREPVEDGVRSIVSGAVNSPRQSHENWLKHKGKSGWVFGDVKDANAKTHPCMVPYDELPDTQRLKDEMFMLIVGSMK